MAVHGEADHALACPYRFLPSPIAHLADITSRISDYIAFQHISSAMHLRQHASIAGVGMSTFNVQSSSFQTLAALRSIIYP